MNAYYLAVEPPALDLARLSLLMRRLGDPSPLPHITVIEPPLLTGDASWVIAARDVVARSEPISISLEGLGTFSDRVLYRVVNAPGLFDLRLRLLDVFANESRASETRPYVPHLTLAVARRGESLPGADTLDPLLRVDPFTTTELTLFCRGDAHDGYRAWQRFSFGRG